MHKKRILIFLLLVLAASGQASAGGGIPGLFKKITTLIDTMALGVRL